MNTWLILLFLLLGNQGGGRSDASSGCGCADNGCGQTGFRTGGNAPGSGRNRGNNGNDCGCARERDNDCGCDGAESRFEPRFDARPFNNNQDCGCDNQ